MTRLFLVTANVGSVFENLEDGLSIWLDEFVEAVRKRDPQFVAIHFQETGGKNYVHGSNVIDVFFKSLLKRMNDMDFRRSEGFVDSRINVQDQFTALTSIYFVHNSVKNISIWDFQDGAFVDFESTGKLHIGNDLLDTSHHQIEKFPQEFFPDCKWSRKGFLWTRWRIEGVAIDLVNIHLFHDACNLIAAQEFPSRFAKHRERGLNYTIDKIQNHEINKTPVPLFIFGDFNFRLNTFEVINRLTKEVGDQVIFGSKKFSIPNHEAFFQESCNELKMYDYEVQALSHSVKELTISFPPTYPYEEDITEPRKYLRTRCPAWCDRVIFSHESEKIMCKKTAPEYNVIGSSACMGDHKPVFLTFHLKSDEPQGTKLDLSCDTTYISRKHTKESKSRKKSTTTSCSCFQLLMGRQIKRSLDRNPSIYSATSTSMATASTVVGGENSVGRNSLEKHDDFVPHVVTNTSTTSSTKSICHCSRWKIKKCSHCTMRLDSSNNHGTSNKLLYTQISQKSDKLDGSNIIGKADNVTHVGKIGWFRKKLMVL